MNGSSLFPSFLSKFKHAINKTTEDTIKVFSFSFAIVLFTKVRIKISFSLTHSMRQQKPQEHTRAFSPGLKDDQVLGTGLGISGVFSHLILTATPQSLSISSFLKTRELGRRMPGESRRLETVSWAPAGSLPLLHTEPGARNPGPAQSTAASGVPHGVTGLGGPVRRGGWGREQPGKQSQHRAHPPSLPTPKLLTFQILRQRAASQNQSLHHFFASTYLLSYVLFFWRSLFLLE